MNRQQAIIGAVIILALGLIFSLIFGKSGCVLELSDQIGRLLRQLDGGENTCDDGLDNDGDSFADTEGTEEGYLPDEKCNALNIHREGEILDLETRTDITSDGGLIVLGKLRLHFPSGALARNTEVVVRRIPHQSRDVLSAKDVYEFTPTGLSFQQAVLIQFLISPSDPDYSGIPGIFTEEEGGERIRLRNSGYIQVGSRGFLTGFIEEFSKKGAESWEEFESRYSSALRQVEGECFTSYRETQCPPEAALCHGGLRGNVECVACPIVPGGDFCCLCPSEFPDSDFPCGNDASGNPLQPPLAGCTKFTFDIEGNIKCPDLDQALPQAISDGRIKGAATAVEIPEPVISPQQMEASISIRQGGNNRFCTVINLMGVHVPDATMKSFFPNWPGATANSSCQREWDRFLAQLKAHERRHAEIGLEAVEWLRQELQNPSRWPITCEDTETKARQAAEGRITSFIEEKHKEAEGRKQNNNLRFDEASSPVRLDCSQCP